MAGRPPVSPQSKLLPFQDQAFSWDTFEEFFCDFLAAGPRIIVEEQGQRVERRVISARPYGRKGDDQHGIDISAEMEGGEVWAFQCKHYRQWGPADTREAIAACTYPAARKFLLVTRPVSEESFEEIAKHPDWTLWDARDISRHFLACLPPAEAARLLYLHFGPGWAERLLGLPGNGPLISAGAKFAPFRAAGRVFHHRLPLVGRATWLSKLDDFVQDEAARVLALTGAGGLGKSRLLAAWSEGFAVRHPDVTLRFLSDRPGDFGPALDATPKPLVVVFDDAHRLDEVRRALLPELPRRENVKLVLALRPGPGAQVRGELLDAGFDSTQIQEPAPLTRLEAEEALQLAEEALGPRLALTHRLFLRQVSRDCPLIAVLTAELLHNGTLKSTDLTDTPDFQTRVFEGLLRDARPVEARFGEAVTHDFLRLLALLAPVKVDEEFLGRAAAFLGSTAMPAHRVADLLGALDAAGLLLTTGAGVRITPDLLSDHLAFTACYDRAGRNTTFAARLLEHFSPEQFPKIIQHLAEAEWRASREQRGDAASVVEPLWRWFQQRFEASAFFERAEQIKQWANVAHLQPARTLELAVLALRLSTAPEPENPFVRRSEFNSHAHVLDALPGLLKPLAERNPKHVGACLDLLWPLGRDRPQPASGTRNHPITVIGEIASFQPWKDVRVLREVLAWAERLTRGTDWISRPRRMGWLLSETLQSGRTFTWRPLLLNLEQTAPLREGVRALCRELLARGDVGMALAVLPTLEKAMDRAYPMSGAVPPPEWEADWLGERRRALALLDEMLARFNEPVVHHQVRGLLLRHVRYPDGGEFQATCREVLGRVTDTLSR